MSVFMDSSYVTSALHCCIIIQQQLALTKGQTCVSFSHCDRTTERTGSHECSAALEGYERAVGGCRKVEFDGMSASL